MAKHAAKKLYRVVGVSSNPKGIRADEVVRAFSEMQAKRFVERKTAQKHGRVKVFWSELEAYEVAPRTEVLPAPKLERPRLHKPNHGQMVFAFGG